MDGIKTLDDVMQDAVLNPDIIAMLDGGNGKREYKPFVDFQVDTDGFQPAEPWDGDIEHAPILFLSPHPAYNRDENCPRYYRDSKKLKQSGKDITLDELKTYLRDHFRQYVAVDGDEVKLNIPLLGDGDKERVEEVIHWSCVYNHMADIFPSGVTDPQMSQKDYVREVMKYAALVPLVPFRINSDKDAVTSAADICWEEFTRHTLYHAGASIFVLIGGTVLNTFLKQNIKDSKKRQDVEKEVKGGNIYRHTGDDKNERLVVWLKFCDDRRHFVDFNKGLKPDALAALKSAFAGLLTSHN